MSDWGDRLIERREKWRALGAGKIYVARFAAIGEPEELARMSDVELLSGGNFGRISLRVLRKVLAANGYGQPRPAQAPFDRGEKGNPYRVDAPSE